MAWWHAVSGSREWYPSSNWRRFIHDKGCLTWVRIGRLLLGRANNGRDTWIRVGGGGLHLAFTKSRRWLRYCVESIRIGICWEYARFVVPRWP